MDWLFPSDVKESIQQNVSNLVSEVCNPLLKLILSHDVQPEVMKEIQRMKEQYKVMIILYSHTSLMDFIHSCLITGTYKIPPHYVMHHWWYNFWLFHPILKHMPIIPVFPKYDGGDGSSVERIVSEIKRLHELHPDKHIWLFVNPSGRMKPREWKSGWYYVAKQLNCPVRYIGFDYPTKKIKFGKHIINPNRVPYGLQEVCKRLGSDFIQCEPYVKGNAWPTPENYSNFDLWLPKTTKQKQQTQTKQLHHHHSCHRHYH